VAGPPTGFEKTSGDTDTVAVNHQPIFPLIARLVDRYHNAVGGRTVTWSVPRGPFTLDTNTGTTDANGFTTATLSRQDTEGTGTARVALDGGPFTATFVLTVGPPEGLAIALWGNYTSTYFQSVQNGTSRPAVDTIPVGATVQWWYLIRDYGEHRVISVGAPSFAVALPKGLGPQFHSSSTFTTAGTYHYADFYFPTATGEIVVR
jgi:hypothetical protein